MGTIFNKSPTYSPTPQPAECVDEPNDKFFLKTKGKNKKPVYQKCKWLAKKPAKKIKKICKKSKSYDGTGPAKSLQRIMWNLSNSYELILNGIKEFETFVCLKLMNTLTNLYASIIVLKCLSKFL